MQKAKWIYPGILVLLFFLPPGLQIVYKGSHRRIFVEFVEIRFFKLRSQLGEIIDLDQQDRLRRNEPSCPS